MNVTYYLTITSEDFYRLNILAEHGHRELYKKAQLTHQNQINDDKHLLNKLSSVVQLRLEATFKIEQE